MCLEAHLLIWTPWKECPHARHRSWLPITAGGWQGLVKLRGGCQQPGRAPTEPQCHLAAVRFLPRPLSDFLRPSSPGPGGRWPSPTTSKQQGSSKWDSRETIVHIETEAGALAVLSDFSLAIRLSQAFIHVFALASLMSTYADDCNWRVQHLYKLSQCSPGLLCRKPRTAYVTYDPLCLDCLRPYCLDANATSSSRQQFNPP